ncbi:MAG TPA: hypothetical protein VGE07_16005, partial [Herpetosiphonaceae bacterium]
PDASQPVSPAARLAGAPAWLRDRRVLAGLIGVPLLVIALVLATSGGGEQDAATGAGATPSATVIPSAASDPSTAPATSPAGEVSAVTAEPPANPEPTSPAELAGEVAVENAFENGNWRDGSAASFQDGRYRLASGQTYYRQASGDLPNGDVAITLNVEPLQGQAGIAFGLTGLDDHYRLLSAPDGSWSLERRFGSRTPIPIASGSGAGTGRLALVLRGAQAKVYFNDALLAEADLPSQPSRKYGVILVPGDGGEALFDTLTVRAAP